MCANAAVKIAGACQVVLLIRDVYHVSRTEFFPSRIRIFPWIRIKEFKYFNPDPDPDFLPIPDPGSRGQKGTGSRIRNTVRNACIGRGQRITGTGTWWSILGPDEPIGHVEVGRVVVHILHNDRKLRHVLQSRARTVLVLRESENNNVSY